MVTPHGGVAEGCVPGMRQYIDLILSILFLFRPTMSMVPAIGAKDAGFGGFHGTVPIPMCTRGREGPKSSRSVMRFYCV